MIVALGLPCSAMRLGELTTQESREAAAEAEEVFMREFKEVYGDVLHLSLHLRGGPLKGNAGFPDQKPLSLRERMAVENLDYADPDFLEKLLQQAERVEKLLEQAQADALILVEFVDEPDKSTRYPRRQLLESRLRDIKYLVKRGLRRFPDEITDRRERLEIGMRYTVKPGLDNAKDELSIWDGRKDHYDLREKLGESGAKKRWKTRRTELENELGTWQRKYDTLQGQYEELDSELERH